MPLLRAPARPERPHLPARERVPTLTTVRDVPANPALDPVDAAGLDDACARLQVADLHIVGRIVDASNGVLLVRLEDERGELHGVYKPTTGERPLWDFPVASLAQREVATYELSRHAGLGVVPPTVLRDGPLGPGSVQWWIHADEAAPPACDVVAPGEVGEGVVPVLQGQTEDGDPLVVVHRDGPDLRRVGLLDVVANNADRKGSALLTDEAGHTWGIDHGICLHEEPKLRTVLWGWAGDPLTEEETALLAGLADRLDAGELGDRLSPLLTPDELTSLRERVDDLLATREWPVPLPDRPAIPWPVL